MTSSSHSREARRVGLVSDTHGRLDYRVPLALDGVERILHAGDVGAPSVLWELQTIAPVAAVLGNVDRWELADEELPPVAWLTVGGARILVVHDRHDAGAGAREADVVVFGHSHMPLVERVDGVLWVNPGSASQARRSKIGRSIGVLTVPESGEPSARILPLSDFGEQR